MIYSTKHDKEKENSMFDQVFPFYF